MRLYARQAARRRRSRAEQENRSARLRLEDCSRLLGPPTYSRACGVSPREREALSDLRTSAPLHLDDDSTLALTGGLLRRPEHPLSPVCPAPTPTISRGASSCAGEGTGTQSRRFLTLSMGWPCRASL